MYDPVTARFMQEDTYAGQQQDPLSLNLYTYCHNSPLMYWDPTGHSAQTIQGIQDEIDQLRETGTHSAGLWSQINALEAAKERLIQQEEDARKKEGEELTAMKDHPEFAELDHVRSAMEAATYMGTYTYLSVMENNIANYTAYKPGDSFEEWEDKQNKPDHGDWFDHIPMDAQNAVHEWEALKDWAEYGAQVYQHFGIDDTNNAKGQPVNIELFLAVIAQTDTMSPELEEFYRTLHNFFDAVYGVGQLTSQCDCGGLSRGIYEMLGYAILEDGSKGKDTWKNPADGTIQEGSRVSRAWTASDHNNIVYEREEFGQTPDLNLLQPGDVIYYDLKGNNGRGNGWADHVAVYVGQNANGEHIIIETCSGDNPVRFVVMEEQTRGYNSDNNTDKIIGVKRYLDDV
jgi:hypothetical protein